MKLKFKKRKLKSNPQSGRPTLEDGTEKTDYEIEKKQPGL